MFAMRLRTLLRSGERRAGTECGSWKAPKHSINFRTRHGDIRDWHNCEVGTELCAKLPSCPCATKEVDDRLANPVGLSIDGDGRGVVKRTTSTGQVLGLAAMLG